MFENKHFAEAVQVVAGFGPVDMSAAANTGDRVNLEGYRKAVFILFKAAGTAGDDPTITLQQHDAATSGNSKDLVAIRKVWKKQGTLSSVADYTLVEQTAAATYTDATSAEAAAIWVVEIDAADLDAANGYTFASLNVADVGTNAQLGACLVLLIDPHYVGATLASGIA